MADPRATQAASAMDRRALVVGTRPVRTLRIEAPHFCAAVTYRDMTMTAPILRYMVTWNEVRVRAYCAKKRWACQAIGPLVLVESGPHPQAQLPGL